MSKIWKLKDVEDQTLIPATLKQTRVVTQGMQLKKKFNIFQQCNQLECYVQNLKKDSIFKRLPTDMWYPWIQCIFLK